MLQAHIKRKYKNSLDSWALSQTNISSETSDLAGNSFHTFFALNNSTVDVIDTFYNIGHGVNICKNLENDSEEKGLACFWVKPSDYHVAKGSRVVVEMPLRHH